MQIIFIFILIVGLFSLLRIITGLLISFTYQVYESSRTKSTNYEPLISVVIPAYNEQKMIKDCVMSVINQSYHNRQIIIVNDGSTDRTGEILKTLKSSLIKQGVINRAFSSNIMLKDRLIIVNQFNQGKSYALNNGIKNFTQGDLITVLDADSQLAPNALEKMVVHFSNPRIIAMAINVRIKKVFNLIDLVQRIEYMLGYRLKGSEPIFNLEYIVGGVGSTFRRWALAAVGYYDTNTVTEDIDMTMKLVERYGNLKWRITYAPDVVAYTPAVHSFMQLVKQRYRWKLGRFQSLFKHRRLLFNRNLRRYSLSLSWWKLPKVFVEEFFIFIEPLLLAWMLYITFQLNDWSMLLAILLVYFMFALITISFERLNFKSKLGLIILSPITYFFLYVIAIVDFICLIKCLGHFNTALNREGTASWEHVDR